MARSSSTCSNTVVIETENPFYVFKSFQPRQDPKQSGKTLFLSKPRNARPIQTLCYWATPSLLTWPGTATSAQALPTHTGHQLWQQGRHCSLESGHRVPRQTQHRGTALWNKQPRQKCCLYDSIHTPPDNYIHTQLKPTHTLPCCLLTTQRPPTNHATS